MSLSLCIFHYDNSTLTHACTYKASNGYRIRAMRIREFSRRDTVYLHIYTEGFSCLRTGQDGFLRFGKKFLHKSAFLYRGSELTERSSDTPTPESACSLKFCIRFFITLSVAKVVAWSFFRARDAARDWTSTSTFSVGFGYFYTRSYRAFLRGSWMPIVAELHYEIDSR